MINKILLVLLLSVTFSANAQRNILKIAGFAFDSPISMDAGESQTTATLANRFTYQVGYERTFGSRVSLGINWAYHYKPDRGYSFSSGELDNAYGTNGGTYTYYYSEASYKEVVRFGFYYESKYFFSQLSEEPEGAFVSMNLGYYFMQQESSDITAYDGSSTKVIAPAFTNNYNLTRLGVKLGVQYGGELFVGYYLNLAPSGRRDNIPVIKDRFDIASGNFVVGFAFGFGF